MKNPLKHRVSNNFSGLLLGEGPLKQWISNHFTALFLDNKPFKAVTLEPVLINSNTFKAEIGNTRLGNI